MIDIYFICYAKHVILSIIPSIISHSLRVRKCVCVWKPADCSNSPSNQVFHTTWALNVCTKLFVLGQLYNRLVIINT